MIENLRAVARLLEQMPDHVIRLTTSPKWLPFLVTGALLALTPIQLPQADLRSSAAAELRQQEEEASPDQDAQTLPEDGSLVPSVMVTRDDGRMPANCDLQKVALYVGNFLEALNTGTGESIAASLSPQFQWFSMTEETREPPRNVSAYSVADLLVYAAARQAEHENLRLLAFDAGPNWAGVGVGYFLFRTADDLDAAGQVVNGKGQLDCNDGKIIVWSMGDNTLNQMPQVAEQMEWGVVHGQCPAPGTGDLVDETAVVACTWLTS
jgi:hypothetical protein